MQPSSSGMFHRIFGFYQREWFLIVNEACMSTSTPPTTFPSHLPWQVVDPAKLLPPVCEPAPRSAEFTSAGGIPTWSFAMPRRASRKQRNFGWRTFANVHPALIGNFRVNVNRATASPMAIFTSFLRIAESVCISGSASRLFTSR